MGWVVVVESDEEAVPCAVSSLCVYLGELKGVIFVGGMCANALHHVLNDRFEVLWFVTGVASHEEGESLSVVRITAVEMEGLGSCSVCKGDGCCMGFNA